MQLDSGFLARVTRRLGIGLDAQWASGDEPDTASFEGWNQLFPTAHKFLGLRDVMGPRGNIASAVAKLRYGLTSDLTMAMDQHLFFRPQTADSIEHYAASEGDLWAQYKLGTGQGARGQYSLVIPNAAGPLGTEALIHYIELQLRLDI